MPQHEDDYIQNDLFHPFFVTHFYLFLHFFHVVARQFIQRVGSAEAQIMDAHVRDVFPVHLCIIEMQARGRRLPTAEIFRRKDLNVKYFLKCNVHFAFNITICKHCAHRLSYSAA